MKCANVKPGSGSIQSTRFSNKLQNENERRLFQSYWKELVQLYGTYIDYYTYDYSLSTHDFFYGEHPLAPFSKPHGMTMMAQFNNDSLILAKFGIQTDADATFIVTIQGYREAMGDNAEPKAGDLIRMTELGWDRPGGVQDINATTGAPYTSCDQFTNPIEELCKDGIIVQNIIPGCDSTITTYICTYDDPETFNNLLRGAQVYEITERRDEVLTQQYNVLLGHYIWILHAKRFDYSYQPEAPRVPGGDQITDGTGYGKLSGGTDFPEEAKKYPQDIDTEAKKDWDYVTRGTNTNIYGKY